ncbi:MAG: hypothetical protein H6826_15230 [Planctomycetes bacterium]|nr:hypothetical protein [Planctomycetota bacterium]
MADDDFRHVADLPTVADVFHLWHDDRQLWAVDRTDASLAVFDLATHERLAVVPIPADLRSAGGVPHDVVVGDGHAFVSIVGLLAAPDVVVKLSTETFLEVKRANVGKDPHLFLHPRDERLFVACQESDAVHVLDRTSMASLEVVPVSGGHGIWVPPDGNTLFVTNFAGHEPGGPADPRGPFALFAIGLGTPMGPPIGTHAPDSAPHNLASTADGLELYVTHSNGGTHVSVYNIWNRSVPPRFLRTIKVGANPFGICRID